MYIFAVPAILISILYFVEAYTPDLSDLDRIEYWREFSKSENLLKKFLGRVLLFFAQISFYFKCLMSEIFALILAVILIGAIIFFCWAAYRVIFGPRLYQ